LIGDLNFSLGVTKSRGPRDKIDNFSDFFVSELATQKLLDIKPMKLKPTWINHHIEDQIAKIVDTFLVTEAMVGNFNILQQWVGSRGESNHSPILLKLKYHGPK